MTSVLIHRWVLVTVVDEGPSIAAKTFRTKAELVACARAEHDDLFDDDDFDERRVDDAETSWQLVIHGDSGWYGSRVDVVVEVSEDGSLS